MRLGIEIGTGLRRAELTVEWDVASLRPVIAQSCEYSSSPKVVEETGQRKEKGGRQSKSKEKEEAQDVSTVKYCLWQGEERMTVVVVLFCDVFQLSRCCALLLGCWAALLSSCCGVMNLSFAGLVLEHHHHHGKRDHI
eukprot:3037729-Rhodomonas_salina.1